MAHFALCSRVDVPPAAPTTLDTTMPKKSAQTLTWQQQEDLEAAKVSKSKILHFAACFTYTGFLDQSTCSDSSSPRPSLFTIVDSL